MVLMLLLSTQMSDTWTSDYGTSTSDYSTSGQLCENNENYNLVTLSHTVFYMLVFVFSLVGNNLVVWVLVKYESLESLTNIFILNLCLSDLLFSCLLPFLIVAHYYNWIFGEFLCKLYNMLFHISLYSSIIFLMVMTVQRYLSVVHPLSSLGSYSCRSRAWIITGIWVASILASVPDTIFHTVHPNKDCDYSEGKWFLLSTYKHNFFFLFSMVIILFCYVQILRTLFRSPSKRRHRTVRLIFTIVMAYFLSWGPYNVIMFLKTLIELKLIQNCEVSKQVFYYLEICKEIAFSHCCFNPVLYVFVGIKFRRHLKMLCRRVWPWKWSLSPISQFQGAYFYDEASFY